jgi:phage terminase large subunit-like protein
MAEKAAKFIQLLPHTKGEWAFKRMPITLEAWQLFIVCCAFGWVQKGSKLRRFREVYTEIPRKNGKSAISAGVALYCFTCDNEFGAEVYSGATTEKQAWEVFRPARLMCKRTPLLVEAFGIEVNASNLNRPEDGARFEPLIGNPGDGASPHCAIVDEYHEHPTDSLYTTMLTGMGARRQPLMWAITTAGYNIEGPCYDKRREVIEMLNGTVPNEELFGVIYTVDEGMTGPILKCWKKLTRIWACRSIVTFSSASNRELLITPVRLVYLKLNTSTSGLQPVPLSTTWFPGRTVRIRHLRWSNSKDSHVFCLSTWRASWI